jgi:hypothetical protein
MEEGMRPTLATLGLCSLLMLAGCESSNWGFLRKAPDQGIPPTRPATAPELVAYLNQNSMSLKSLTCQDVDIDCTQGIQSIGGIRGRMACEQPRDFRLTASMLGKTEIDLGSNDQEFWYWMAKSNPPYQFFCSYEDLRTKHVPLPFPFQPEWVMETLGMATYPVNGQYQLVSKRDSLELIQDTVSLQGQPVRKVVVFNRNNMKNGGQIRAYILRDMNGKDICSAQIQDVQRVGGVVVPYKVQLDWPAERLKLSMQINKPNLNQLSPELAQRLFVRSPLKDIQPYDLARQTRGSEVGGQVQPTGGYVR